MAPPDFLQHLIAKLSFDQWTDKYVYKSKMSQEDNAVTVKELYITSLVNTTVISQTIMAMITLITMLQEPNFCFTREKKKFSKKIQVFTLTAQRERFDYEDVLRKYNKNPREFLVTFIPNGEGTKFVCTDTSNTIHIVNNQPNDVKFIYNPRSPVGLYQGIIDFIDAKTVNSEDTTMNINFYYIIEK